MKYNNDNPIESPQEDLFERKYFSYYLAKGIINLENDKSSFVIGILGKWGEGKTSAINMTLKYLKYLTINKNQRIEDIDNLIKRQQKKDKQVIELNLPKFLKQAINIFLFLSFYLILLFILNCIIIEIIIKTPTDFCIKYFQFLVNCRFLYEPFLAIVLLYFVVEKFFTNFWNFKLFPILIPTLIKNKKEENYIPISFEPWNYTSKEQILKEFFNAIINQINYYSCNDCLKTFANLLLSYSKLITNIDIPYLANIFENKDIKNIKDRIYECLQSCDKQIVVVIDNIDRLLPEEELLIFQTVKLLADFPHVVYLLSFDKERVCSDIKTKYGFSGEEYIKKILQIEKTLPILNETTLENLFINGIKDIVVEEKNFYEDELRICYNFAYKEFYIKNIRDLNKFLNTFTLIYSAIKDEKFCLIDLISITMIELFENELYQFIQVNKSRFFANIVVVKENDQSYLYTIDGAEESLNKFVKQIIKFKNTKILQIIFPDIFLKIFDGAKNVLNDRKKLDENIQTLYDEIDDENIIKHFKPEEY